MESVQYTVTDKQGRPADRISLSTGYGSDGDSHPQRYQHSQHTNHRRSGTTCSNRQDCQETEARIYTGIDTETAAQHTGRLKNSFDKDAVHNAIRLNFLYLIQPQTFYCLNKFPKAWAGRNLSNAPALSKCRLKGFQTAFALQTA